jgi:hypothetical protein
MRRGRLYAVPIAEIRIDIRYRIRLLPDRPVPIR